MKQFQRIAVVDSVIITDKAKEEIRGLSKSPIIFPRTDCKHYKDVIKRVEDSDAILGSWNTTINQNILKSCAGLKYIGVCGTSMSNIDLDAVKQKGIIIKNVTDYGDEATAEYIFLQLLSLARGAGKYQWKKEPTELNGKTIGIVGLGHVGQQVARVALGFNMKAVYNSKTRKPPYEARGVKYLELDELLMTSDIISLHVPKNRIILRKKEFDLIPKNTILVDTCLGTVVDIDALLCWLAKEENFVIIDHSKKGQNIEKIARVVGSININAGKTIESRERLSKKVLDNIKEALYSI